MRPNHRFAQLALVLLMAAPVYAQEAGTVDQSVQETTPLSDETPAATPPAAGTSEAIPATDAIEPPGQVADPDEVPAIAHEHPDTAHAEATTDDEAIAGEDQETVDADADADEVEVEATTSDTPASAVASSIAIPPPPAGVGHVVFFREKKFTGGGVRFKVRENGEELGKLSSGAYFVHAAQPGVHEYVVHSESEDVLTLDVEEGETYYVQGSITMGVLVGRPNLSPSDETAFAAASAKLKPAKE